MSEQPEVGIELIEILLKHPGYPINNKQALVLVDWVKQLQATNQLLLEALENLWQVAGIDVDSPEMEAAQAAITNAKQND